MRLCLVSVRFRAVTVGAGLAAWLVTGSALAQADKAFDTEADDSIAAKEHLEKEQGELMPGEKPKEEPPEDMSKYDVIEKPGETYRFIGMRFRDTIIPKFMTNIFADGGSSVNVFSFGPEFSTRKDNTEFDFAISFADFSMQPTLFKGHGDGDISYEEVASDMKGLFFTLDILYDIPLDDKGRFSVLVGGGVGFGLIAGNLYRNQVAPSLAGTIDPDDPNTWEKCAAPGSAYCDGKNDHYGTYDEPSWANGGSKPFIFPAITIPQVSFRYKPLKQLQTRFDMGFSLTGFFFGLSAGYGL